MALRRDLLSTALIQGSGAAVALLAPLLLVGVGGASALGTFSVARSQVDFLASVAFFGLPQAVIFFGVRGALPTTRALRVAAIVASVAFLAGWVAGAVLYADGQSVALLMGLAVAAVAGWTVLRATVLAKRSVVNYNLITALPQWLLLLVVVVVVAHNRDPGVVADLGLLVVSFGLPALLAWLLVRGRKGHGQQRSASTSTRGTLLRYAVLAGLTGVFATAARAWWLDRASASGGPGLAGHVAMVLLLVQLSTFAYTMIGPVLMAHWAGTAVRSRLGYIFARTALFAMAMWGLVSLVLYVLSSRRITAVPSDVTVVADLGPLLGFLVASEVVYLVASTLLLSVGLPGRQACAEAGRLLVLVAAGLLLGGQLTLTAASEWWIAGSLVSSCLAVGGLLWGRGRSIHETVGTRSNERATLGLRSRGGENESSNPVSNVWVCGGLVSDTPATDRKTHRHSAAVVLEVSLDSGAWEEIANHVTPPTDAPENRNLLFKAGSIDGDQFWLPTESEVLCYEISSEGLVLTQRTSQGWMNDLHYVEARGDRIYVVSSGLERVFVLNRDMVVIEALDAGSQAPAYSPGRDYRATNLKPHTYHANRIIFHDEDPWILQGLRGTLYSPRLREILPLSPAPSHDGVKIGDLWSFTTVTGELIGVDLEARRVVDRIALKESGGWCRGLLPLGGGLAVLGWTSYRATKVKGNRRWIGSPGSGGVTRLTVVDLSTGETVQTVHLAGAGLASVHSVHEARQPRRQPAVRLDLTGGIVLANSKNPGGPKMDAGFVTPLDRSP